MMMKLQKPKYMSIEEFLDDTRSDNYYLEKCEFDFKYQYDMDYFVSRMKNLSEFSNDISRWVYYKNEPSYSFDCDGSGEGEQGLLCWLSRDVYRRLWKWNDLTYKMGAQDRRKDILNRYGSSSFDDGSLMGPETMNSYNQTFRHYLGEQNLIFPENRTNTKIPVVQRNITALFLYRLIENLDDKESNVVDVEKYLKTNDIENSLWNDFAKLTHAIGNFTLTFKGFNKNIAGDYWDLKLQVQYKESHQEKWHNYVNTFFHWDYVDDKYEVKSLSSFEDFFGNGQMNRCDKQDSHSKYLEGNMEYETLTTDETMIYLISILCYIRRRGIFMVAMLKIQHESEDSYDAISRALNSDEIIATVEKQQKLTGFEAVLALLLDDVMEINEKFEIARNRLDDKCISTLLEARREMVKVMKRSRSLMEKYINEYRMIKGGK